MSQDLLSDRRVVLPFVSIYTIAKILGKAFRLRVVRAWEDPGGVEEDSEGGRGGGWQELYFWFVLKPRKLATLRGVGLSLRTSELEFAKVCGRGVFSYNCILHSYFSHLMRLATINLSFQVLWYIFPCFIFTSLWRASKKKIFLCEGERGGGLGFCPSF